MTERFRAAATKIDNGPGVWSTSVVSVIEIIDGIEKKVGEYNRDHPALYDTFVPFTKNGRWYALYSPNYTATRIMELPSCKDIGGEEPNSTGFCPVDFYVPFDNPNVIRASKAADFGFVAGCVWGDDSSWKIQYLDLSRVERGVLVRKELFGYLSMPDKAKRLRDCIDLSEYDPPDYNRVRLSIEVVFDFGTGRQTDPY